MSPKPPDPRIRETLIETAARLLVEHGPDALTTRRLAAEVGTSTMAVYTYFSGMDKLRTAVAREGFDRLSRRLDMVELTDDPVADIISLGSAYFMNALTDPHLYHFMFGERPEDDPDCGRETFERLIDAVERSIQAGRFEGPDAEKLATQIWVMSHGIVTLHMSGLLTLEEALESTLDMVFNLFVAFGDGKDSARRSIDEATQRILADEAVAALFATATAPA